MNEMDIMIEYKYYIEAVNIMWYAKTKEQRREG